MTAIQATLRFDDSQEEFGPVWVWWWDDDGRGWRGAFVPPDRAPANTFSTVAFLVDGAEVARGTRDGPTTLGSGEAAVAFTGVGVSPAY